MIRKILKRNKKINALVEPDEIFLDSKNLQNFDRQQFEGRIEKSISKKTILSLGVFFILFILTALFRLGNLQIKKGEVYKERSEKNTLEKSIIFAERGIIYDRNKKELAWNKKTQNTENLENSKTDFLLREYLSPGFSHLLGYVSYPAQDKTGRYWQTDFIGKDGLEKEYDTKIQGEKGSKINEVDAKGNIHSENIINAPKRGEDLVTTIDMRIQKQIFNAIKNLANSNNFQGGAGVILNIENGEVLTSVSFPEYNSEILSLGKDAPSIKNYLTDKRKVFMDRTISGLYTPGSIVKPFFAIGALAENIIDQYKQILSTGSISIPNPYFPDQKTVFKDWRINGWTNMAEALAVSSDIYFYEIGGGFEGQKGLGINNLEKYAKLFGIGEKTNVDLPDEKEGTIPSPEWKIKNFKGDAWRIGNTYHTAIGQYGFQVTPLQMARAVSILANDGILLTPHFLLNDKIKENEILKLDLKKEYFEIVRKGMRQAVTVGTAKALNVPYVEVAAKTGTAQLGVAKNKVNSWVMGFFPYQKPKYAFIILMEAGPANNSIGASSIMRETLDFMSVNNPEYFQ